MKKIQEMMNKLTTLKNAAQEFLNAGKVAEAREKMTEITELKDAIEIQKVLDQEEKEELEADATVKQKPEANDNLKKDANIIRAMIKKVSGKPLTSAENALLLPTANGDEKGTSYLLPTDVSTKIRKKIREYKSLTEVVGYLPAGELTGSFPVEDFETVSELVDFEDGTDGEETNEIKFKNVSYQLKEKAAFIKLSNTLLAMTDENLINYVVGVFAKKAVITENKMILAALKKDKTVKNLAGWAELKSSINVDLDPAVLFGTCIVTNQDGFDFLDKQLDGDGRPILQPDPTMPTRRIFNGFPVHVFSNTLLASDAASAPFFYGNLKEAVSFVDLEGRVGFATSSEAGFMSNTTIARLIEFIDVVQVDKSDKCYIYATVPATGTKAATK